MKEVYFSSMVRYEDLGLSLHYVTPHQDYAPHTHDYFEMEIILSGSAVNSINSREFAVSAGDVFVVGKGATHEISQIDGLELYNIGFNKSTLHYIGQDLLEMPGFHALFLMDNTPDPDIRRVHLDANEMQQIRFLLDEMYQEYTNITPGFRTALLCDFARLILFLSRCYSQQMPKSCSWQVAAAAAEMEQNFSQPISMSKLASSVFLSERHFRRQFEKAYGITPSEYLLGLRLRTATKLLSSGSRNITDVAIACGFSDGNYFSRVFRRTYGISPSDYRARYKRIQKSNL